MNQRPENQPHRRMTRAEVRRRRRSRAIRRVAGLTVAVCLFVGGLTVAVCLFMGGAAFLLNRHAPVLSASAASAPAEDAENSLLPAASSTVEETNGNALGLTADEAAAMLADPLMVLVNHTNKMPDDYTFETKECGSKTAVNKTLQTVACDAFLEMQKAAAAENVTIWMQSGYRSVKYQTGLYERKTKYYTDQGYDLATAKEKAAAGGNPPGDSEHNCGLAADLNSPEHTGLDEGFENTTAFRWLCENAEQYGFILRYPQDRQAATGIVFEPWHWRYVGVENALAIRASGLSLEEFIALQRAD